MPTKIDVYRVAELFPDVSDSVYRVANHQTPVFIKAPNSVEAGIVAKDIHSKSGQKGDFVTVLGSDYSDATDADLMAAELRGQRNLLRRAEGGTLYIHGVDEVAPELHMKLKSMAMDREYKDLPYRLISSGAQTPKEMLEQGEMDDRLMNRLQVYSMEVPALASNPQDIPRVVDEIAQNYAIADLGLEVRVVRNRQKDTTGPQVVVPQSVVDAAKKYDWPGNLVELHNVIGTSLEMDENQGQVRVGRFKEQLKR